MAGAGGGLRLGKAASRRPCCCCSCCSRPQICRKWVSTRARCRERRMDGSESMQDQGAPWTPRPKSPTPQTRAETAGVSLAHTPSGHRWEALLSQHLQCRCSWLLWLARSGPVLSSVTITQGHLYKHSALGPATPPPCEHNFHLHM